jgi:hypothetical protein
MKNPKRFFKNRLREIVWRTDRGDFTSTKDDLIDRAVIPLQEEQG